MKLVELKLPRITTALMVAAANVAEHIEVTILPDELIVGRVHDFFGRQVLVSPEVAGSLLAEAAGCFDELKGKAGHVVVSGKAQKAVKDLGPAMPPAPDATHHGEEGSHENDYRTHSRDGPARHGVLHHPTGGGKG
jgi:hypothetical protein